LTGFEENLEIVDTKTSKTINKVKTVHKKGIYHIVISNYGNYFVTIGGMNKAVIWDGSVLNAMKKFNLSFKYNDIKFIGFNGNETTLYIVSTSEILVFKLKKREEEKELKKLQITDRKLEGCCLIETLGVLIAADDNNFISIYDINTLERVNLNQKFNQVNVMKFFNKDSIWVAFSNNTIAVYNIVEGEIKFNVFEKKTPFEVLEIR